jgi:hypothetical protein
MNDLKLKIKQLGFEAVDYVSAKWRCGDWWGYVQDKLADDIGETHHDIILDISTQKLDGYPKWTESDIAEIKERLFIAANRVAASIANDAQAVIDEGVLDD